MPLRLRPGVRNDVGKEWRDPLSCSWKTTLRLCPEEGEFNDLGEDECERVSPAKRMRLDKEAGLRPWGPCKLCCWQRVEKNEDRKMSYGFGHLNIMGVTHYSGLNKVIQEIRRQVPLEWVGGQVIKATLMSLSLSKPATNEEPRMGRLLEGAWGPRRCGACSFPKTRNTRACLCADRSGNRAGGGGGGREAWTGFRT